MYIVADTCTILMLLRIEPNMLKDTRFECVTTQDVRNEILQTPKFKDSHPWRSEYRDKIQVIPEGTVRNSSNYRIIEDAIVRNSRLAITKDGGKYNLSKEDRSVIVLSQLLSNIAGFENITDIAISTTDGLLKEFAENEYEVLNIEPLDIISNWLEDKLLCWDDDKTDILRNWALNEPQPSLKAKRRFKGLSGFDFPCT